MRDSYLWDRDDGEPDPFIERLEHLLATKRYRPHRGLPWRWRIEGRRGGFALLSLLAAAVLVASVVGLMRFGEAERSVTPSEPDAPIAYEQPDELDAEITPALEAADDAEPALVVPEAVTTR